MERDIKKIISQMTLEEKAGLCSGLDFWHTKSVERLGVPSIMMTDGPHGLRKQADSADHLGLNASVPATCFPSAVSLASSWDRELIQKVGTALGEECQAEDVAIILGPGANIKRSPLCGRNFEYFSEDPYLSSEMAASHIAGVQSQGIGTSLKHFAVNNQEHRRMTVDAIVDERALREIYLASFEEAVKKSDPWTVMCSYNKLNGVYNSHNEYLLTKILREEWGFDNFVVSDWGAVSDIVSGVKSGLELEMPSSFGSGDKKIADAVRNGELSEEVLDKAVERILKIVFKAVDNKKQNAVYDKEVHHKLARQVAAECMVLLKNEDGILPLKKSGSVAVIGAFAKKPRYQGGGSSHINPTKLEDGLTEIQKAAGAGVKVSYAEGFKLDDSMDEALVEEAKKAAFSADVAVIFAGLPDIYESEGYDRKHMRIPENQIKVIEELAKVQKNIVIVLCNGSPIEMPWFDKTKAVLEGYIGGQAIGGAAADVLFGEVNPSGKLAETFPRKLSDNPSFLNFPGEGDRVEYKEGIFVGYRYYDKKEIEPLFPFGYGLSYTSFEYTGISVDKQELLDNETLTVKISVKNTGKAAGKEVVQLYVRDVESSVIRPDKELKGFAKVDLQPGEEKTVEIKLVKRAFAYYNTELHDWYVESGVFELLAGGSSRDIVLKAEVKVNSTTPVKRNFSLNSTIGDLLGTRAGAAAFGSMLANSPMASVDPDTLGTDMLSMIKDIPLRALLSLFGGPQSPLTEETALGLIAQINSEVE
jgi:beta-glucosidase